MGEGVEEGEPGRCPECGGVLLQARLDGLCAVCLLGETPGGREEEGVVAGDGDGDEVLEGGNAGAGGGMGPEVGRQGVVLLPEGEVVSGPAAMHLPGYRLTREIARGGMGIIYEAVQVSPARTVAIKMLLPHLMEEPSMRERFRREAQAMAGLDHAGILPVYEVGDYNGLPYFSMKLASGGTLAEQSWRYTGNWRLIAGLMAELADAIQTAHGHGVLHRDLKPGNILFDEQGRAYLSDFGIAKQLAGDAGSFDLTKTATLLGTPNYLAPEWAAGTAKRPTTAGDVYGLGAIFYQLLTGDPPHRAGQLTTLLRQIADEAVVPPRVGDPNVPRDLEIICLKALAKEPGHRYAGAHEMAEDLRLWLGGRPILARAASPVERMWRWSRRNPLPAALAAVLATALTVGGTLLWRALQTSRGNLHDSLVMQAGALRETGRLGNRSRAIGALEQAVRLRASDAGRAELSSALAMTDVREVGRVPYAAGGRLKVDGRLERFTSPDAKGHLTVRRIADGSVVSSLPGEIVDPEGYGPFSPDGRFLFLRPKKGSPFSIWDCEEHRFRLQGVEGSYVLFAPDSRTLAIGKEDGTLTLLDVITGAVVANYPTRLLRARPYSFSADGSMVIVGQFQDPRFVVMDVRDGMILLKEKHPKAANVRCAVWRPDNSGFFIGTESFKIYEWALANNSLPRQLIGHQGNVLAMAMDPKGEWLVSQSDDGTTRLWNTAGVQTMAVLPYTGAEVRFSGDGRRLLCEDREGHQVRMVELVPSPICRQFSVPHPDPDLEGTRGCWYVTFSPDGGLLSAGDTEGIFHFDGHTGAFLGKMPVRKCWSLGWARDGSALYSASNTGLQRWPVEAPAGPLAGAGDSGAGFGEAVAVAGEAAAAGRDLSGETWSLGAPALWAQESEAPRRRLNHLAVSLDHQLVALAFDEHVALYRPPHGANPLHLPAVPGLLDAVAVSPEGSLVAASQQKSGGVFVWDTGRLERMLVLPTQFAEATLAFHPDGQRLYTGDFDALTCWNARTGSMVWRVPCPARSPSSVQCVLSVDGSLLAANLSPETIHLIQPGTGVEITRLRHPSPLPITYLAISHDQSRLAAFCVGHVVQLWDLVKLRGELAARGIDWKHPALPVPQVPLTWRFPAVKGGE